MNLQYLNGQKYCIAKLLAPILRIPKEKSTRRAHLKPHHRPADGATDTFCDHWSESIPNNVQGPGGSI